MAYARLGTIYGNLGEADLAEEYRKKAFELKDRTSENERLYITAHYYMDSGQLDKGIAAYELYKQTYPRELTPHSNLAVEYVLILGEFEKGFANAQDSLRVDPDDSRGYFLSAAAYLGLNRPDEAKAVLKAGLQHDPSLLTLHDWLAQVALAQGDMASLEKEEGFLHNDPYSEMLVKMRHGDMAASHGQVRKAQEIYGQARQVAQQLQIKESEAAAMNSEAWAYAVSQNRKPALEAANTALGLSQSYNMKLVAAGNMAMAGDMKKALEVAAELSKKRPDDTLVQSISVPIVQAAAALSGRQWRQGDRNIESCRALRQRHHAGTLPSRAWLSENRPRERSRSGISADFGPAKFCARRSLDVSCSSRTGPGLCAFGRFFQESRCLPGLLCAVERRRSRPSHPEGRQSGIREAAVGSGVAGFAVPAARAINHEGHEVSRKVFFDRLPLYAFVTFVVNAFMN